MQQQEPQPKHGRKQQPQKAYLHFCREAQAGGDHASTRKHGPEPPAARDPRGDKGNDEIEHDEVVDPKHNHGNGEKESSRTDDLVESAGRSWQRGSQC